MKSLKKYFDEAEKEQVEHLIIEDGVLESYEAESKTYKMLPYIPKAPTEVSNNLQNFTSRRASMITSYRFSPMVASDDSRLRTTPLHQFDFQSGAFTITFSDNKIDDVKNSMKEQAKTGLYSFQQGGDAHLLLNINQTKKSGIMINNHFEPLQYMPKFLPQLNMVRDALFLNECISFIVTGLTIRAPGKFLFIDKLTSNGNPDPFDDRFFGQWMILKVIHMFQQGNYVTQIIASKVDAFKKIWDEEESSY